MSADSINSMVRKCIEMLRLFRIRNLSQIRVSVATRLKPIEVEVQWASMALHMVHCRCNNSRQSLGKSCIKTRPPGHLENHMNVNVGISHCDFIVEISFRCTVFWKYTQTTVSEFSQRRIGAQYCFMIFMNTLSIRHNHHLLDFSCQNGLS